MFGGSYVIWIFKRRDRGLAPQPPGETVRKLLPEQAGVELGVDRAGRGELRAHDQNPVNGHSLQRWNVPAQQHGRVGQACIVRHPAQGEMRDKSAFFRSEPALPQRLRQPCLQISELGRALGEPDPDHPRTAMRRERAQPAEPQGEGLAGLGCLQACLLRGSHAARLQFSQKSQGKVQVLGPGPAHAPGSRTQIPHQGGQS